MRPFETWKPEHPELQRSLMAWLDVDLLRAVEDLDRLEDWATHNGVALRRPNSMNMYGVILDDLGYGQALSELVERVFSPLSSALYSLLDVHALDHHHGFVVDYSDETDIDLGFHVDDAEVTVNICLSEGFSGGDLFMRGRRCFGHMHTPPEPEEAFVYAHTPGRALIHAGMHRHGAYAIEGGRRRNLILWCRSSVYRERAPHSGPCPAWCGAHRSG